MSLKAFGAPLYTIFMYRFYFVNSTFILDEYISHNRTVYHCMKLEIL